MAWALVQAVLIAFASARRRPTLGKAPVGIRQGKSQHEGEKREQPADDHADSLRRLLLATDGATRDESARLVRNEQDTE